MRRPRRGRMKKFLVLFFVVAGFTAVFGGTLLNGGGNWYRISVRYETGALKVLYNSLQFGQNTTDFDFVKNGGEEILFPVDRYSVDFAFNKNSHVILLYQPLTIETKAFLTQETKIDYQTFPASSAVLLKYGFSFWRASYVYDLINTDRAQFGIGASFQLRNASIIFQSLDGKEIVVNQNLGPVPILKITGKYDFGNGMYIGTDVDGFYASSKFFNGANFDFEGSIIDASVMLGFKNTDSLDTFFNVRFLGGSAAGTSQYAIPPSDGYTSNYLATMSFTVGFEVH